jgi:ribosomal protein S18 acetylase RimI-like enzyme
MPLASMTLMISQHPATIADIDFARSVHHRAYRDVIERQYGPWDEAHQDEFFDIAWSVAVHQIIFSDGVRCGYSCIENRDGHIYLRELVIDPAFQGRGIGTYIIREVLERGIERGVPVRLQTHIVNRAADLYRRMGFRETGRTKSHLLMEWKHDAA